MRLEGIKYDEEKWKISSDKEVPRISVKDDNPYKYWFALGAKLSNIIGLEQLSENEFLVLIKNKKEAHRKYRLVRYWMDDYRKKIMYDEYFDNYGFITNDTIFLENVDDIDEIKIYSIEENSDKYLWFDGSKYKVRYKEENKKIKKFIIERRIDDEDYLLVEIDVKKFEPIANAYSSVHNSYIPVSNYKEFDELVKENIEYKDKLKIKSKKKKNKKRKQLIKEFKKK